MFTNKKNKEETINERKELERQFYNLMSYFLVPEIIYLYSCIVLLFFDYRVNMSIYTYGLILINWILTYLVWQNVTNNIIEKYSLYRKKFLIIFVFLTTFLSVWSLYSAFQNERTHINKTSTINENKRKS